MVIYVDADACPVINIVEKVAKQYNIEVNLFCDDNHYLQSDYSKVFVIEAGRDAVDFAIVGKCKRGDIVVTQDYGLAALVLGKGAYSIHQSGGWYTDDNIDTLLMERHIARENRRSHKKKHIKGHFARTHKDDERFYEQFNKLVVKAISNEQRLN